MNSMFFHYFILFVSYSFVKFGDRGLLFMGTDVNNSVSYAEFLSYLPTLKSDYKRVLASFSLYEQKEKNTFIRGVKIQIYSLKYGIKKKDRIWEYLNDDIPYAVLEFIK